MTAKPSSEGFYRAGHGRAEVAHPASVVAGCSTGERYSIAILLAEVLGSEISDWNIRIFATDLDDEAVGFARRGFYPTKLLDDLPADLIERYFEKIDHGQRVSKSIRQMVIFGNQDLTRGVPFPRMDLVVCRNLLIYLKPELQRDILDLFAYSLHQTQGYLFLGKAETAPPSKATFELVNKKWKVYHCVSGPLVLPAHGKPLNARQAEWQAITRRIDAADRQTPPGRNHSVTPHQRGMFRCRGIAGSIMNIERHRECGGPPAPGNHDRPGTGLPAPRAACLHAGARRNRQGFTEHSAALNDVVRKRLRALSHLTVMPRTSTTADPSWRLSPSPT